MKRKLGSSLLVLLAALFLLCACPFGVYAEETTYTALTTTMEFGQTEARSMLRMINAFRTGGDAWAWNEDNTQKVYYNNLKPLTYSQTLEYVAMQRAAEIAFLFEHTRPDGSSCFSAYPDDVYFSACAENIAYGYTSANSVYVAWREDNDPYLWQGHRRAMISPYYTAVGIGHAYYNGAHYWVQEFASVNPDTYLDDPIDGDADVTILIPDEEIRFSDLHTQSSLSIPIGESVETPLSIPIGESVETPLLTMTATVYQQSLDLELDTDSWVSANPQIARIEDGRVIGVSAGKTTITATYNGKTATVTVTVTDGILLGDVTGDGKINASDYLLLKRYVTKTLPAGVVWSEVQNQCADVTGDGKINASDYFLLKRTILNKGK